MAIHAQNSVSLNTKPAKTSLLGGHFIYRVDTSQGTLTPSSANIIENVNDSPTLWGYNTHIGAGGIKLRYNQIDLSTWTKDGVTLYYPKYNGSNVPIQGDAAAILNTTGLKVQKGGVIAGTAGQNGFVYLSSEDYQLKDSTHSGLTINGYTPTAAGTDGKASDDFAWREVIGTKFGVDSEGNLYAAGAHVDGDIVAQSLTIGSGANAYNGMAAINISGYDIEIIVDSTGVVDTENTTYLYPHLYHNGIEITTGIDYSDFIWYQDGIEPGTAGDANNQGRYLATYGHNYRVIYDFDDGAVDGGTAIQNRTIDPSKYITKVNDTGITIHPEVWTNQSDYLQLNSTTISAIKSGVEKIRLDDSNLKLGDDSEYASINSNGLQIYESSSQVASFGETIIIGKNSNTYVEILPNSLKLKDSSNNAYFSIRKKFEEEEVVDYFCGTGAQTVFRLGHTAINTDYIVKVNDVEASPNKETYRFTFDTAPELGDIIDVTYTVRSYSVKGYDIGIRKSNSIAGEYSVAQGLDTIASGTYTHSEGQESIAQGSTSHAEGFRSMAVGGMSHAEGSESKALGMYSHAEGDMSIAKGSGAHAEGNETIASGGYSHAEGSETTASGGRSHAEGESTISSGSYSHAEGYGSQASSSSAHAEGFLTEASNSYSHSEGSYTYANGNSSHSEGRYTHANGDYSHGQNLNTIASGRAQTVLGTFNIEDVSTDTTHPSGTVSYKQYAIIVGNGTGTDTRANALTVDWNGYTNGGWSIAYGICSTARTTTTKEVTVPSGFILKEGVFVAVKFTYAAYSGAQTLNVNSTGAIPIKIYGTTNPSSSYWQANEVVLFVYDGTNWMTVK